MAGLMGTPRPEQSLTGGKEVQDQKQEEEQLKKCFIGSIDQGTTSSRFLIFDGTGTPVASHQVEFKQIYPYSGLVGLKSIISKQPIDAYTDGLTTTLSRLSNL